MSSAPLVVLLLMPTVLCADAFGKDRTMLVDTLTQNFLAEQVSSICALENKSFVNETSGALGDARSYAERVKQEVVAGLALDEGRPTATDVQPSRETRDRRR
jgi:hypothetical protein